MCKECTLCTINFSFELCVWNLNAQWHAQDGFEGFDKSGVSFELSFEYFYLKESVQGKYCPSNMTRIPKQQSSSLLLVCLCPLCCSEYLVACSGLCSAVGRQHRELEVGLRRGG